MSLTRKTLLHHNFLTDNLFNSVFSSYFDNLFFTTKYKETQDTYYYNKIGSLCEN